MTGRSSGGVKKQHAAQLFKTEMCKFYLQGSCENGRSCSYAHDPNEIRHKPDLTNTSMCKNYARDGVCSDPQCRFAHSEAQLRATSGFFKMKMCGFFESGKCKNGDSCRFAHTPDELRPPSQASSKKQQQAAKAAAQRAPRAQGLGGIVEDQTQALPLQAPLLAQSLQAPLQAQSLQEKYSAGDEGVSGHCPAPPPPLWPGPCGGGPPAATARSAAGSSSAATNVPNSSAAAGSSSASGAAGGSSAPMRRSRWSDVQDSGGSAQGNQSSDTAADEGSQAMSPQGDSRGQDGSDSAEGGSQEGGSQVGSSSRFSGHSSVTEVPRSDHTHHSGNTNFTSESGKGAAGGGKDNTGSGDNSSNIAETTTGASSRDVPPKSKHKKREAEQPDRFSVADGVSTLFVSNIPTYFTQGALLSMLEDLTPSMRGAFDFFYCPWEQEAMRNLGYATINFTSAADAVSFQQEWCNKELCRSGNSEKRLRIIKASLQGLKANLDYFSGTNVVNCTDQRFRPLYRDSKGSLTTLKLVEDAEASQPAAPQQSYTAADWQQPLQRQRRATPSASQEAGRQLSQFRPPALAYTQPPGGAASAAPPPAGVMPQPQPAWAALSGFGVGGVGVPDAPKDQFLQPGFSGATSTAVGYQVPERMQVQERMQWPQMMMMAVPGGPGAGHGVQWQGHAAQQPRLQAEGSPVGADLGYETPEPLVRDHCRARAAPAHAALQAGAAPAAAGGFAGAPRQGHHGQPQVQPFQQMVPYMMMPMEAFVPMDGPYGQERNGPYGQEDQGFAYRGAGVPMTRGGWQDSSNAYGVWPAGHGGAAHRSGS